MLKVLFLIIFIFGCAKSPEYKEVYKEPEKTNRFSDYDTESVYLYVPSTLGAPRKITSMRPFYQGQEQLVKLKWTKQGLSIYGSDEDYRFDFSRNQKPVFTIPGEYKAYRCVQNNLGECTNKEEENREIIWNERPYFYPDLEGIDFATSINVLDLSLQNNGCFIEKKQTVTDYLIKKGIINIEVEKEFVISKSRACIIKYLYSEDLDISDLSFKMTFFYSLVRLKDLASPDYIPKIYPREDQEKFGFFKIIQKFYDENYFRKVENVFLNRWNPSKRKITYHLSESFNKPGQEIFKEISKKAFEDINKALKRANITFELELLEPSGKKSGDLRYNTVVLITDPLENGLLGYGPSVSNPLTGEILSAHVNMYSGVLRRMVPSVYKKMVKLSYDEIRAKRSENPAINRALEMISETSRSFSDRSAFFDKMAGRDVFKTSKVLDPRVMFDSDFYSKELGRAPIGPDEIGRDTYTENLEFLIKHNAYHSELYLNGGRGKKYIEGIKELAEIWNKNQTLKDWEELSKEQKEKVSLLVLPHVYRTTFIHEIGHNLGLRHNFKGSVDRDNFFTEADFDPGKKTIYGVPIKYQPSYSSIMDYGYSELNELPIFGKYDIAALRFGYASEVELKSGEFVKIDDKGLGDQPIKEYEFCTDENVSGGPLCNRFDEGTTYTEIMEHYEKKYTDFYETRNFRNFRDDFNLLNNRDYYFARRAEFSRIRKIFESWEYYAYKEISNKLDATVEEHRSLIQKKLDSCKDSSTWQCRRILDLDKATQIAGKFFLNILKTPNRECLVLLGEQEDKILLSQIHSSLRLDTAPESCFDPIVPKTLKEKSSDKPIKIIGDRGKYLSDLKEYNSKYRYSSDLSARGIWIDKILAMENLLGRNLSLNRYNDPNLSFFDHPVLGPQIEKFIDDLILQRPIDDPAPFLDKFGQRVEASPDRLKIIFSQENNPTISEQRSYSLIKSLDLPLDSYFFLSRSLLDKMLSAAKSADPNYATKSSLFFSHLGVKKVSDHIDLNPNIYNPQIILNDGFKYAGSVNYDLATRLIEDLYLFGYLENLKPLVDHIETYDPPIDFTKINDILSKIYYLKKNPYLDISQRRESWKDPIGQFYSQTEGAKRKSLELSADILKVIIDIYDNEEIDFEEVFKNENPSLNIPSRALYLKKNLSKEELIKSRDFLVMMGTVPADFPFKELYKMPDRDLKMFMDLSGEKNKVELEVMLKGLKAF